MTKKKVLIVGANSYVGTSFEKWLLKNTDSYEVDTVGTLNEEWKNISFCKYDSILHVAGIAHVSANPKMEELYYKINRDLAIEVCKKAKLENVSQFIFMSSIIIYGKDGRIGQNMVVTEDTEYDPVDFYGKSKLEADLTIQELGSNTYATAIIRTPVVYGPGCKGNFPKLIKLARKSPVFLNLKNERSMIYIDNLCEFLKLVVDNNSRGVFYPQNLEYVSTSKVIQVAASIMNKKIYMIDTFNGVFKIAASKITFLNKVFGNKVYSKRLSNEFDWRYCIVNFEKSIEETLKELKN